jgi:hypothetical protein
VAFGRRRSQPLSLPPRELVKSLRPDGTSDITMTQADAAGVLQHAFDELDAAVDSSTALVLEAIQRLSEETREARAVTRALSTPPPVGPLPDPPKETPG